MYAEVAQSIIFFFFRVNLVSEYFWKRDVSKKPLLGPAPSAVPDAGHLAVVLRGLVQALVTVHMLQGELLKWQGRGCHVNVGNKAKQNCLNPYLAIVKWSVL